MEASSGSSAEHQTRVALEIDPDEVPYPGPDFVFDSSGNLERKPLPEPEQSWDKIRGLQAVTLREPLQSGDHVRLLLLYPPGWPDTGLSEVERDADASVQCDVFQVSLDEVTTEGRPMYAALSYCWGDDLDEAQMTVGEHSIFVRKSLHQALMHVRYMDRPRLMWVDSLCINQDDLMEKSEQVMRMGSIYGQAHVVSWLGISRAIADFAPCLSFLARLAALRVWLGERQERSKGSHSLQWASPDFVRDAVSLYNAEPMLEYPTITDGPWVLMAEIYSCTYWTRMWVYQEIHLAKSHTCLVGLMECNLDVLVEAGRFLRFADLRAYVEIDGEALQHVLKGWPQLSNMSMFQPKLPQLTVGYCTSLRCKDPRDHIYGLVGLYGRNAPVDIDYSLTIAQVFAAFAVVCMRYNDTHGLDQHDRPHHSAFRDADSAARRHGWRWSTLDLPSWCPDYAMEYGDLNTLLNGFEPDHCDHPRTSNLEPREMLVYEPADCTLRVQGYCYSRITTLSNSSEDSEESTTMRSAGIARQLQLTGYDGNIGLTFLNVFLQDIFNGSRNPRDLSYTLKEVCGGYMPMLERFHRQYIKDKHPEMAWLYEGNACKDQSIVDDQAAHFASIVKQLYSSRNGVARGCFRYGTATIANGDRTMVSGPDGLRVGDEIFFLPGTPTPTALRRQSCGRYQWIGRCNVHIPDDAAGADPWHGLEKQTLVLI